MDENLFHYYRSNQDYQNLLEQAERARLIARIKRIKRLEEGAYPHWLAVILTRLSQLLIAAGSRLQDNLERAGSLQVPDGEQPRQYSYGD